MKTEYVVIKRYSNYSEVLRYFDSKSDADIFKESCEKANQDAEFIVRRKERNYFI